MRCQVAVVGAGPGGATAAFFLAAAGVDVLLLDKKQFPRDKACGDAQVRSIQPLFREMGVYEEIRRHARILHGAGIGAPSGRFHRFATPSREIFCTPRCIFDDILRRAAVARGARFIPEFTATEIVFTDGRATGVSGRLGNSQTLVTAEAVIVADGAFSRLSRRMNFRSASPCSDQMCLGMRGYFENVRAMGDTLDFIYPAAQLFPAGYVWIFPVTETLANVGVFITAQTLRRSGMTIPTILSFFGRQTDAGRERLGEARQTGPLRGSVLPTFPPSRAIHANGALVVGDAANMVEPLFGAGLPQAMTAGKIAAEVLGEALRRGDVSAGRLARYEQRVQAEMGPAYALQTLVREHLFSRPADLEAFLAKVQRGDDPDLAGRGANETMALYIAKYQGLKLP